MDIQADLPDLAELERLAKACVLAGEYLPGDAWNEYRSYGPDEVAFIDFVKVATPSAILALIVANQVLRSSAERYWWLRENAQQDVDGWRNENPVRVHALSRVTGWRERIDESVDAAIAAGDRA
ncbi:hypothetical protein NLO83_04340 [Pseudomonas tremae]|uniref:hypothetical protein n=1 Tax=Pseudomonas syringae group TaxID=136849 RepID=UPI0001AF4588|nr:MULTISPECIES: hypothetical protein [Pseudomonas syringae group]MCQ3014838.1 hypothetical protein [Pseudomonas tremae]QGL56631.1 hypothetical protein POR16_09850 [Pseudomonas coronafaciens pv. oryzae str. 1_6]RMM37210.1 hypothetical protein ALQ80_00636 [Pseudomonas coronafaciens pv. oryzae]